MRFTIGRTGLGAVVALGVLMLAPPLAAQQGEVTGRVTDKTSGQAIAGAQAAVVGTTLRAVTGQDGRYRLVNVPPGAATIRIAFIGYGSVTQTVTVTAGTSVEVDAALAQVAVGLDAVVVTATGDQAVRERSRHRLRTFRTR